MSYDVLEEVGLTKVINVIESDGFAVQINGTKPQFLLPEMTPYYARIYKKEKDCYKELELIKFDNLDGLYKNFDETEIREIPSQIKKKISKELREKVVVLPDIDQYFKENETSENRKLRKAMNDIYKTMSEDMSWVEKNKRLLYKLSDALGLPRFKPPNLPDYTEFDRPLEPDEVRDDLQSRMIGKEILGQEEMEFWNKTFKTELTDS